MNILLFIKGFIYAYMLSLLVTLCFFAEMFHSYLLQPKFVPKSSPFCLVEDLNIFQRGNSSDTGQ